MRKVKNTRRKGYLAENEIVKRLQKADILCRRVGMSGMLKDLKGDILITREGGEIIQCEVKCRKTLPKTIIKQLDKDNNDILFLREDRTKRTLAVMDLELLLEILEE